MLRFLPEFSRLSCVFPDMKFCRNRHLSTRRKKPSWRRIFILSIVLNCLNIDMIFFFISQPYVCMFSLQHTSHGDGRQEVSSRTGRSGARCRNSIASCADEQPHIGNYRLLKTIGKGNFAKVKLARHILTGREVKWYGNE